MAPDKDWQASRLAMPKAIHFDSPKACLLRPFCTQYAGRKCAKINVCHRRFSVICFWRFIVRSRIPAGILLIIDTDDVMPTELHMFVFVLAHFNSALNPVFYATFNPRIKQSYKHFLHLVSFGLCYSKKASQLSASISWTQATNYRNQKL